MSANVWPVDAVTGSPDYSGRMLRQTTGLTWGRNPSRPLGAISGVVIGTPASVASATSSLWTVTPFGGVIDGETSAIAGPYNFSFDSNQTGSVTAADATNPRIDLLYVRISDPAEGDGSSVPVVELLYLAGTAAATPTQPATPARSMPVWAITVPKSGGGSPTVSFVGSWAVAAGGIRPVAGIATATGHYVGEYVDDPVAGLCRWNGTSFATTGFMWQGRQATGLTSANATYTNIVCDTLDVNTAGLALGGGGFRVPVDGIYEVSGNVKWLPNATGIRSARFAVNGVAVPGSDVESDPTGASNSTQLALARTLIPMSAGDGLSLQAIQTSGGTLGFGNGSYYSVTLR